jgi:hypothetical protein
MIAAQAESDDAGSCDLGEGEPLRKTWAPSLGIPTTATSTSWRSLTCGRRMNVRGPENRGVSKASGGP